MGFNAATRLVSELQNRLKRQFGDESGVQITDSDIVSWINDGMRELNRINKVFKSVSTTNSVAGQNEYTFPGVNIVSVEQLYYDNAPVEYRSYNNVQELILRAADALTTTGQALVWYEFGGSLFIYPTPSESDKVIKLLCVVAPTLVMNSTDVIPLPDDYYEALYQYCVAQAYETDDDMKAATAKTQQYANTLTQIESRSHDEQYYPMITVDAEDAY